MKYMLLIYSNEAAWTEEERQLRNSHSSCTKLASASHRAAALCGGRDECARSRWQDPGDRWTVCRDAGTARRLLHDRGRQS
ncbi:MAG: hypothetical protein JWN43_1773 [Gammaproteobacteria bacterium]|nr:hypothetical protein [Gammaproteobacteria bacterium]